MSHLTIRHRNRRLDQILGRSDLFAVDSMACAAAARTMTPYQAVLPEASDLARSLLIKFVAAAICHQFNWDFLYERLAANLPHVSVAARSLAEVKAVEVERWLRGYTKPERIRGSERAALLRDVGRKLLDGYDGLVINLIDAAQSQLTGSAGLLARLDAFTAFGTDPIRKKRNVFVHEIVRERLARFCDEESIEPAIDYHITRVYLRSGRVFPRDAEVMATLKVQSPARPRLVTMLRAAVADALRATAFYASLTVPDVNYIEWQVGRALCHRVDPLCTDAAALAETDIASLCVVGCPYSSFCLAKNDAGWRELKEPEIRTVFF